MPLLALIGCRGRCQHRSDSRNELSLVFIVVNQAEKERSLFSLTLYRGAGPTFSIMLSMSQTAAYDCIRNRDILFDRKKTVCSSIYYDQSNRFPAASRIHPLRLIYSSMYNSLRNLRNS